MLQKTAGKDANTMNRAHRRFRHSATTKRSTKDVMDYFSGSARRLQQSSETAQIPFLWEKARGTSRHEPKGKAPCGLSISP
jgi:hypothetical protein